jgi:hypothetical protein
MGIYNKGSTLKFNKKVVMVKSAKIAGKFTLRFQDVYYIY